MAIILENISYSYRPGTPFAVQALNNCSLRISQREFVGLIGHTGSGKSTLIQQMNGLLYPTSGRVEVDGVQVRKGRSLRAIRHKVGLVFQYPEHQLFEETVAKDVSFGPKNLGLGDDICEKRARKALGMAGLEYDDIGHRSPFDLSGGQRRRVAIAGVLAMGPSYLILDEPTAGLDPKGRRDLLSQIQMMHETEGVGILLVTHNMDEIASMAERIAVIDHGCIVMDGPTERIFARAEELEEMGLDLPETAKIVNGLRKLGLDADCGVLGVAECAALIHRFVAGGSDA